MADGTKKISRRQFLKASATAVVSLAVVGSAAYYLRDKSSVKKTGIVRPPGSIKEDDFLYACIKCGLCVQICPVNAIKLADWSSNLSYGTPYIDANIQACDFSCDAIQCAETCPTGAINFKIFKSAGDKAFEELREKFNGNIPANVNAFGFQILAMRKVADMGIAKITDKEMCLAYHGKGYEGPLGQHHALLRPPGSKERIDIAETMVKREVCDLCVVYCPLGNEAIELKETGNGKYLPEVKEGCVGCGVCQMLCPTQPKAIVIEPEEELV